MNFRFWKFGCKRKRNHARTGAHVQDLGFGTWDLGFKELHEFLRFGTRNHCAFIDRERMSAKFNRAKQMLERFAFSAAPDEFSERCELALRKVTLELKIKLEPF